MSDNIRAALYDAAYSCTLASRGSEADPILARVVGKHCESGDIVVQDEFLPADIVLGDLLAVPGTGAYCRSMASNYNHVPRPAVVAVGTGQRGSSCVAKPRTTCSPRHGDGVERGQALDSREGGLLGCGVVGTEVVRILTEQADHLAARVGARLEIAGIAVRRAGRERDIAVDPALITTDAQALVRAATWTS